jgi:FtsH-binding integral membrane protein
MANRKTRNKIQTKPKESKSTANRVMQIVFVIFSILIVLSMVLAATATF